MRIYILAKHVNSQSRRSIEGFPRIAKHKKQSEKEKKNYVLRCNEHGDSLVLIVSVHITFC